MMGGTFPQTCSFQHSFPRQRWLLSNSSVCFMLPMGQKGARVSATVLLLLLLSWLAHLGSADDRDSNTLGRADVMEDELLSTLLKSLNDAASTLKRLASPRGYKNLVLPRGNDASGEGKPASGSPGEAWTSLGGRGKAFLAPSPVPEPSVSRPLEPAAFAQQPIATAPANSATAPMSSATAPVNRATAPMNSATALVNDASAVGASSGSSLASSAQDSDTSPAEAVDAFIVVSQGDGRKINGYVLAYAALMVGSSGRLHVITNDEQILEQAEVYRRTLPWGSRVVAADVRANAPAVKSDFMTTYKHQSVNTEEYEAFCLWRWGIIYQYIEDIENNGTTLSTIFTLDADVLPSRPYMEWLPQAYLQEFGRSIHHVMFVPGAAAAWKKDELRAYWLFIQGIYTNSSITEQQRFVSTWGSQMSCSGAGKAVVVPCEGGQQYHVSDMHVQMAFIHEDITRRRISWLVDQPGGIFAPHNLSVTAWDQYACAPLGRVDFLADSIVTLKLGQQQGNNSLEDTLFRLRLFASRIPEPLPLCFLHFAGRSKAQIDSIGDFLKQQVEGSTFKF